LFCLDFKAEALVMFLHAGRAGRLPIVAVPEKTPTSVVLPLPSITRSVVVSGLLMPDTSPTVLVAALMSWGDSKSTASDTAWTCVQFKERTWTIASIAFR
jgi:hypothetical protein